MERSELDALRAAWADAPHDAEVGARLAHALIEAGAVEEARATLRGAGEVSRDAELLVRLGRAFEVLSAHDEARAMYDRAIEADPLCADAHGYAAAVALRRDGLEAAQPRLRRWASICEHPVEAHFALASAMVDEGALEQAADHLQIALDLDPRHVAAHELLGIVLGRRGDWEGSVAAWRAARALEPNSPQTASGLGVALSRAGAHAEAIPLLEAGVRGATERCRLGVSARETGDLSRALRAFEEALELDPEDFEPHAELGHTLLDAGQTERAIEVLERAAALGAREGDVHRQLGRALVAVGRRAQALGAYLKAAALTPDDADVQAELQALQDSLRGVDPQQDAGAEMSGALDVVTLPNLLEFLTNNNSSGLLEVTSDGRRAQVFLDGGRICAAKATAGPRLGDVLLDAGDVTRDALEAALGDREASTLGKALVDRGSVPEDTLSEAMDRQIVEVLLQVVSWPGGAFRFRRGEPFTRKPHFAHSLDARFALMEVMRRLDEQKARV